MPETPLPTMAIRFLSISFGGTECARSRVAIIQVTLEMRVRRAAEGQQHRRKGTLLRKVEVLMSLTSKRIRFQLEQGRIGHVWQCQ